MPSPTEDQWLAVKMCNQELTNCETKAIQNPSVLTVCGTPVIMTDIPGSTHGPGKNITLCYCVISCIEMIMMMMKMRVMMTIMIIIIIIIIITIMIIIMTIMVMMMMMMMMMTPKWKH